MLIEHHHIELMRSQIMRALDNGCDELDEMERYEEERFSAHDTERRAKHVLAYFHAANAFLAAVPELHNMVLDLPQHIRLRKLQLRFRS